MSMIAKGNSFRITLHRCDGELCRHYTATPAKLSMTYINVLNLL